MMLGSVQPNEDAPVEQHIMRLSSARKFFKLWSLLKGSCNFFGDEGPWNVFERFSP